MDQSRFRRYSILGQVGAWFIFFLIFFMEELSYSGKMIAFFYALAITLTHAALVYVHYYKLLPYFHQGRRGLYFVSTGGLLLLFAFGLQLLEINFPFAYEYDELFVEDVLYNLLLATLIVAVTSVYYFVEAWIDNIQMESQLRNEKLKAELSFLKSQINPHFLFNTLNNIYSFVQTGNEKSASMLERLSSILRFMVYDGKEDKVPLNKELSTVEDLMEIYKMKNTEQENIHLAVSGVKGYHLIPPLLIINIVENACKHSNAISEATGFIRIGITVDEQDRFFMDVSNSIKQRVETHDIYQGVGMENMRRRLDLLYPDAYVLAENKDANTYHLKLQLPLERKQ